MSAVPWLRPLTGPPLSVYPSSTLVLDFSRPQPAIWKSNLLVPAYAAAISALLLALHAVIVSGRVQSLWTRLLRRGESDNQPDDASLAARNETNISADFAQHIKDNGGTFVFGLRLLRLLCCSALLVLSFLSAALDEENILHVVIFGKKGKKGKKHKNKGPTVDEQEWLDMILAMTNLYTIILAVLAVSSTPRWISITSRHLNVLLLSFIGVYGYRDLYPLITFHEKPVDAAQGWLLWAKITLLLLGGCIIPLIMPRPYVPVDPEHPEPEPNPEQTASILSFATYSFLDPVILAANRVSTFTADMLPPLADYDRTKNLKAMSFPHIDAFGKGHKRHIFFGLMRVFRVEYVVLAFCLVLQSLLGFAAPIGIRNLLYYLENKGVGSNIRPWFWILWLFLGPFLNSVVFQLYIFVATRTLARTESIIIQLIFEHSLRIRMKAEAQDEPTMDIVIPSSTPDSASVTAHPDPSESETLHSNVPTESTPLLQGGEDGAKPVLAKSAEKEGSSSANNLVGKINNLISTDLGNITEARDFIFVIVYLPMQITLCIVFLYKVLGWSAFAGMASMVLLFPIPGYIAKLVQDVQVVRLKATDARVESVSETMNVLRMIKLFGWENKMKDRIAEKREVELKYIWQRQLLDLVSGALNFGIPMITMISTYATYVSLPMTLVMKQELSASIVFSSMTVFDILKDQMGLAFYFVNSIMSGKVSLDRVNDFLHNTELLDRFTEPKEPSIVPPRLVAESTNIGFHDASFNWSDNSQGSLTPSKRKFTLRVDNDLFFPRGQISLIVGPTGSGKTSLLMALLGEMHYTPLAPDSWFNLPRADGIAYAAQESWVQNETIKENILFGAPYDEDRYNKVIDQCCLARDISMFDAGDKTEVGEKGITLSGGQKARITLARAVYSNAQILLLDDVLAALDVHTAKWIVEKCLTSDLLKGRTVIMVTHNVALAGPIADFVVSMGNDGRIASQGSISDVLKSDQTLVSEFKEDEDLMKRADATIDGPGNQPSESEGKLIVAEEVEEGHVSWATLKMFFKALQGNMGPMFFIIYLGSLTFAEIGVTAQTWFLGYWAAQYADRPSSEVPALQYLGVYGIFMVVAVTAISIAFVVFTLGAIRASRTLHKSLIESVLGTTLRWLDTTPISRVITRCTQDIRTVDGPLASGFFYLSSMTVTMAIKFAAVVTLTPPFLLPGILVAAAGGWCGQLYMKAQLAVKREMSNAKAPVIGHFGAAIAGLPSLRAYGAQEAFIERSLNRIDRYTRAGRTFYNLNRWVCIRIDFIGGLFAAGLAAYLVYARDQNASATGFSLNMAVGFSGMILWWIRMLNEFEVQGNSLERIEKYMTIEQEPKPISRGVPPAYWPADGSLHIENLSARYSVDGPKVLQGLSFTVEAGERVGIVGRTGSGKSSLTLALLRCIFTEGRVIYGGIDTNTLNLDALRNNITIIPQVPELLSGTLRQNLDLFDQYEDRLLNEALKAAGLFSLQEGIEDGKLTLDSPISSGGSNLSVGQRQIIALARAIVRGSKLLILDEATSAIDHETDSIIQTSLRNKLSKDVTVLTVAHRLQTIMDSDKIMVLEAGNIVEFGKPSELLKNNGKLRALVDESGDKDNLEAMVG